LSKIPFFLGLFHAFRLLGWAGRRQPFSPEAVRSVRTIRTCALTVLVCVLGAEIYILAHESDDRAGGVVLGLAAAFAAIVVASAMTVLERALQNAVDLQSEQDLTV
jgi:hypothetical protein